MRTPKAKEYLTSHYFSDNRETATMLLGPPGIGKSVSIYEAGDAIAEQLDLPCIDFDDRVGEELLETGEESFILHSLPLVECEPSDITGIPRRNQGGFVRFFPLMWADLMSKNPGILLLDDFLDVQRPDLFSAAYKITLERRAGYTKLDDRVMVVAASNTPEESSLSQMIPAPLANRMCILGVEKPTVNEWANWMSIRYGNEWDKRTIAFLKRFEAEGYLLRMPGETETLRNFPSPRTWTKTSIELKNVGNSEVLDGLLGPEVGQKLYAFLQVSVDIDELVREPYLWEKQSLDAKYMLCLELATWLSKTEDFAKGFELLDIMSNDSRQFPILTFLSLDVDKLTDTFQELFERKPDYSDLVLKAIGDKRAITP